MLFQYTVQNVLYIIRVEPLHIKLEYLYITCRGILFDRLINLDCRFFSCKFSV